VVLEPLIEAYRPYRKTQHHHLRWTMEAIIWRCQNGAKWRAIPTEYGPCEARSINRFWAWLEAEPKATERPLPSVSTQASVS